MRLLGRKVSAVVYDVDGPLVDNWEHLRQVVKRTATEFGFPTDPVDAYFGKVSTPDWQPTLKLGVKAMWPELNERLVDSYCERMRRNEREHKFLEIPGAVASVRQIRHMGLKLGICTTNDQAALEHRFQCIGLELSWFEAMSTYESPYHKPDPRALLDVLAGLRVNTEEAVFVGDWVTDLQTANSAGVRFLAVASELLSREKFRSLGVPADQILDSVAELPGLIFWWSRESPTLF